MTRQERILKVMTSEVNMRKFIDEQPTTLFLGFQARPLTGSFILAYRSNWLNDHILPGINVSYEGSENILLINHHNIRMITERAFRMYLVARFYQGRFVPLVEPDFYLEGMHSSTLATKMRDLTGFWFTKKDHHLVVNSRMHDEVYRYTKPGSLIFNYFTGTPYGSAVPFDKEIVAIPEVRRQWLQDSKKFKQVHKTLYRLGVVNTELEKGYTDTDTKTIEDLRKRIVERMKAGQGPTPQEAKDMHLYYVLGFIPTKGSGRFIWVSGFCEFIFKPRTDGGMVDAFFAKESRALREIYGVFGRLKDLD